MGAFDDLFTDYDAPKRQERWRREAQRRINMMVHARDAFCRVLRKNGLRCELPRGDASSGSFILFDAEGTRFSASVSVVEKQRARLNLVVYKASDLQGEDRFFGLKTKPFFSWDSLKEPRPHKAALLLAKKLKMNPYFEIMEA